MGESMRVLPMNLKYSPGQNIGVGSPSFLQGNLPNTGIEPRSDTLQADSLPSEPPRKPWKMIGIV